MITPEQMATIEKVARERARELVSAFTHSESHGYADLATWVYAYHYHTTGLLRCTMLPNDMRLDVLEIIDRVSKLAQAEARAELESVKALTEDGS